MSDDNVVELRPGIRQDPEETEGVLDSTGTMVALALLAQSYERDATNGVRVPEDVRLAVHIISPLCTLIQKNPQFAIDLLWQINENVTVNYEEGDFDDDYEDV